MKVKRWLILVGFNGGAALSNVAAGTLNAWNATGYGCPSVVRALLPAPRYQFSHSGGIDVGFNSQPTRIREFRGRPISSPTTRPDTTSPLFRNHPRQHNGQHQHLPSSPRSFLLFPGPSLAPPPLIEGSPVDDCAIGWREWLVECPIGEPAELTARHQDRNGPWRADGWTRARCRLQDPPSRRGSSVDRLLLWPLHPQRLVRHRCDSRDRHAT